MGQWGLPRDCNKPTASWANPTALCLIDEVHTATIGERIGAIAFLA